MSQSLWLPSFFTDGMVLQQSIAPRIRGLARPDQTVSFKLTCEPFDGHAYSPLDQNYGEISEGSTRSDENGAFVFELPARPASLDPYTLTISCGRSRRTISNLLFGEVWLSAGQSNMAMPVRATASRDQVNTLANVPYVRVLRQSDDGLDRRQKDYEPQPLADLVGARWIAGDQPDEVAQCSAVAFVYARELHIELKIPVAIIETALGGSFIQSWISRPSIDAHPAIRQHIQDGGFYRGDQDWNLHADPEWNARQPGALYNHKIAPLAGLALRGVLWYQGESDCNAPDYYRQALKLMLQDWQALLRPVRPEGFNFLYVQLAPYFYGNRDATRLAQFNEMLASVRRQLPCPAALLPIYDLPLTFADAPEDWRHPIHPAVKAPIGSRLRSLALGLAYGRRQPPTAPECSEIERISGKLMLSFNPIGDGLRLAGEGSRVRGFSICGPDRIFVEAQAKLLYGVRVLVWHDQIKEPEAVAYAYADMNQNANLMSREQIPVVPFRSDRVPSRDWKPMEWTHCEDLHIWAAPTLAEPLKTGNFPAWEAVRGQMDLRLEPANKSEGDAAFLIRYQTDDEAIFALQPAMTYESQYPPYDWSMFASLSVDLFNADQQMKGLRLRLTLADQSTIDLAGRQTVMSALRWQTLTFSFADCPQSALETIRQMTLLLEDKRHRGEIYMDHIRLNLAGGSS